MTDTKKALAPILIRANIHSRLRQIRSEIAALQAETFTYPIAARIQSLKRKEAELLNRMIVLVVDNT